MMQKNTDPLKKLKQKVLFEQLIWKKLQKFKANHSWPPSPKRPLKSILQKIAQLFELLDHAIISCTACHDNECSIHWSEKKKLIIVFQGFE